MFDQDTLDYLMQDDTAREQLLGRGARPARAWADAHLARLQRDSKLDAPTRTRPAMIRAGPDGRRARRRGDRRPRGRVPACRPKPRSTSASIAPFEARVAYLAQWLRLTREEAAAEVRARDERRAKFLTATLGRDPADPTGYDVVVNADRLGVEGAAQFIGWAVRTKQMFAEIRRGRGARPGRPGGSVMSTAFAEFARVVRDLAPRTAIVLGSGLGGVTADFRESRLGPVRRHPGPRPADRSRAPRAARGRRVGRGPRPALPRPTALLRRPFARSRDRHRAHAAAELGVKRLILTNAAGGIHPSLDPGALMAIRGHIKLVGRDAWRATCRVGIDAAVLAELLRALRDHEAAAGRELLAGVYAALTGPSYETPAEIRALAACGADAVGMSTATGGGSRRRNWGWKWPRSRASRTRPPGSAARRSITPRCW